MYAIIIAPDPEYWIMMFKSFHVRVWKYLKNHNPSLIVRVSSEKLFNVKITGHSLLQTAEDTYLHQT